MRCTWAPDKTVRGGGSPSGRADGAAGLLPPVGLLLEYCEQYVLFVSPDEVLRYEYAGRILLTSPMVLLLALGGPGKLPGLDFAGCKTQLLLGVTLNLPILGSLEGNLVLLGCEAGASSSLVKSIGLDFLGSFLFGFAAILTAFLSTCERGFGILEDLDGASFFV